MLKHAIRVGDVALASAVMLLVMFCSISSIAEGNSLSELSCRNNPSTMITCEAVHSPPGPQSEDGDTFSTMKVGSSDIQLMSEKLDTVMNSWSAPNDPTSVKDTTIFCPATGYADYNAGTETIIQINRPLYRNMILIQFDLSSFPGGSITSAALSLYCFTTYEENTGNTQGSVTVSAYKVLRPWTEGSGGRARTYDGADWFNYTYTIPGNRASGVGWATWGMAAGSDYENVEAASTVITTAGSGTWYTWTITSLVQSWVSNPSTNYGVVLIGTSFSGNYAYWRAFYSSDHTTATLRPKLEITYVSDSQPPTTTSTLSGTLGNNGWYRSNVQVTLNAVDNPNPGGSGVREIKYKIDTGSFQTYTAPFMVTGDGLHTVSYYAVDNAGNTESTQTRDIKIDTQTPVTTHTLSPSSPGASGWYDTTVTVTLTPTDTPSGVDRTYYRLNGGSWNVGTSIQLVNDGSYTVEYYSDDIAGNTEAHKTITPAIKVDRLPPTTTHSFSGTTGNNSWYRSDVQVTLDATDSGIGVDRIMYRVDTGSELQYTAPFMVSGDGTHSIEYYATDRLGHSEQHHHVSLKIDTTKPATTATPSLQPSASGWYNATLTVTLTATDSTSGVEKLYYHLDSQSWSSLAGATKDVLINTDGQHTLYFYSVDVAGNIETVQSMPVNLDTVAPRTWANVTGRINNSWYVTAPQLTLTAIDTMSGIEYTEYRIDNGAWVRFSESTKTIEIKTDGNHVVEYYSVDRAGNRNNNPPLRVRVDLTPPITKPTPGDENKWYTRFVELSLSANDGNGSGNATIYYRIEPGNWRTYTEKFRVADHDGIYRISFYAVDAAGNAETPKILNIRIDTTVPTIVHTTIAEWDMKKDLHVNAKVTDKTSGVLSVMLFYRIGSTEWRNLTMTNEGEDSYSATIPGAELAPGTLEYYINATDVAGNVATVSGGKDARTPYKVKIKEDLWWLYVIIGAVVTGILLLMLWLFLSRRKAPKEEGAAHRARTYPAPYPPSVTFPGARADAHSERAELQQYLYHAHPPPAPADIMSLQTYLSSMPPLPPQEREEERLREYFMKPVPEEELKEPELDMATKLRQLDELRAKNLITEEEYQASKRRLIGEPEPPLEPKPQEPVALPSGISLADEKTKMRSEAPPTTFAPEPERLLTEQKCEFCGHRFAIPKDEKIETVFCPNCGAKKKSDEETQWDRALRKLAQEKELEKVKEDEGHWKE